MRKNLLWIVVVLLSTARKQTVPGWAGYMSLTGDVPKELTTIEYNPIIPHPITDIRSVQEWLRLSVEASKEVGKQYVITIFILGVCMRAYPPIWNHSQRYENHIVMIGTFHLACAYMKMLGKKMDGSGFAEILLEAGLVTPGSLSGVISGKNYSRSLNCHRVLMEAMERLVLDRFIKEQGEDVPFEKLPKTSLERIERLAATPDKETENVALNDENIVSYLDKYMRFREAVRSGQLGKTAALWMRYADHVWLILTLLQAVKTNNFTVYSQCLCMMLDIFFSIGGQNYAY